MANFTRRAVKMRGFKNEINLLPLVNTFNDDHLFVETAMSGNSCGEIFIVDADTFWIMCRVCCDRFNNVQEFINHVIHLHFMVSEIATEIVIDSNCLEENKLECIEFTDVNSQDSQNNADGQDNEEDVKSKYCPIIVDDDLEPIRYISHCEIIESEVVVEEIPEDIENSPQYSKPKVKNECHMCSKVFNRPCKLKKHLKVHEKRLQEKIYTCSVCKVTFTQKNLYRNHREVMHKERIKCDYCDKTFSNKYNFKEHINMHKNERPFQCTDCPSNFYSKASLTGHIRRVHLMERPHACPHCDKRFMRNSTLQIHIRIHTGEKPYVCELCGASYQTSSLLGNHMKRHNNDRRYQCDECEKKFYSHTYLRDHKISVHTEEKPFGCEICEARFSGKPALRKHKKLHLDTKEYVCNICGKEYAQSPGLYAHMRTHQIAPKKLLISNH